MGSACKREANHRPPNKPHTKIIYLPVPFDSQYMVSMVNYPRQVEQYRWVPMRNIRPSDRESYIAWYSQYFYPQK